MNQQNKEDLFIGVDGGGSKTSVRIENYRGQLLGEGIGGPANIRLSTDKAWQSILDAIDKARQHTQLNLTNYNMHVGMGVAGTEAETAYKSFLEYPHPFTSLHVESDAYTACLGAHATTQNDCDGAIIIMGTGVIGLQIENQRVTRVGGWGFPYDDFGGGAWLGLQAITLACRAVDGRIHEFSPFIKALLKNFNFDPMQLVDWANTANSTKFATLAPIVVEYAKQSDQVAISLLKQAAKHIDSIADALQEKLKSKNDKFPCCLLGGIAPFIEPWLNETLKQRLVQKNSDALHGAIILARENAMSPHLLDNIQ